MRSAQTGASRRLAQRQQVVRQGGLGVGLERGEYRMPAGSAVWLYWQWRSLVKIEGGVTELAIENVVSSWENRSIRPDPEYQRGRAWNVRQQQLLIDSIFRGYPLPRFYFYSERSTDPLGRESTSFQIVDGLQRITALAEFRADHWRLLDPVKQPNLFPRAIRERPSPWAGRTFSDLTPELRQRYLETKLPIVLIESFDFQDEVRDLFIRLQAGTPLTRQQVRDAWPGNLGPYIEGLAGKLHRLPRFALFSRLDRRGSRRDDDDELDDPYLDGRQTCAQALRLLLEKRRSGNIVSVDSRSLDDLYQSETDWNRESELAADFERILGYCDSIIQDRAPFTTGGKKAKVTKVRFFTLVLTLWELDQAPNLRIDREIDRLAATFWGASWDSFQGRATSSGTIAYHLAWFQTRILPTAELTELDPKRSFDEEQREALWAGSQGQCGLCGKPMSRGEEEYDHVTPWIRGGATMNRPGFRGDPGDWISRGRGGRA